jgi:hypothetical protein
MVFLWSALSIDWRRAEPATAALSSHIAWGVRLLVLPWGVLWVVLLCRSCTERLGGRRADGPRRRAGRPSYHGGSAGVCQGGPRRWETDRPRGGSPGAA